MFERIDRYLGISCILLGIAGYVSASGWKVMMAADPIGPGGVPKMLCEALIVLGAVFAFGSFFSAEKDEPREKVFDQTNVMVTLRLSAVCFCYIVILPYIGYLLATPLLIAGILVVVGGVSAKKIVSVSLIGTVVLFFVFYVMLEVHLPLGFTRGFVQGLKVF